MVKIELAPLTESADPSGREPYGHFHVRGVLFPSGKSIHHSGVACRPCSGI